jgi:hypothetical protein
VREVLGRWMVTQRRREEEAMRVLRIAAALFLVAVLAGNVQAASPEKEVEVVNSPTRPVPVSIMNGDPILVEMSGGGECEGPVRELIGFALGTWH